MQNVEIPYQNLVENAPVGVYRVADDGELLYANDALVRMTGFDTADQLISENARLEYTDPAEWASFREQIEREGRVDRHEIELRTQAGATVDLLLSGQVEDDADVTLAERKAKAIVGDAGFADSTIEEVAIVVRELTSNIVKHTDEGTLTVATCENDGRLGIEIRAEDFGPGIADVDRALEDGYSTAGSLGCGLGAVHRLMDDIVVEPNENGATGVQIVATRWSSETSPRASQNPITAGFRRSAEPSIRHSGRF